MKRGQGTFEYVLLLGGVLLVVVLAVLLLRGGLFDSGAKDVYLQQCKISLVKNGYYSLNAACVNTDGSAKADSTLLTPTPLPDDCERYKTKYGASVMQTCGQVKAT